MASPRSVSRSRSPFRQSKVLEEKETVEVKELCAPLEHRLHSALARANGDASRVVLVLDLDETCFTPQTHDGLATSAWFEDIMQRWAPILKESDGMSYTDTLQEVLAVVDAFYPRVPVGLTEVGLPAVLKKCKSSGIKSLGLTARRPELAPATWTQMGDRCNLTFDSLAAPLNADAVKQLESKLRTAEHVPNPNCWEGISCERDVWFTANANKGSILRMLLEPDRHVVFADDSLRHVKAVVSSLNGHAASVSSLHFTAATTAAKQKLDSVSCDRSMASHISALFAEKDKSILQLVGRRQTFLRRFIARQAAMEKEADAVLKELALALE